MHAEGYAALDSLQSLPFSCLKIDKAFIDRMLASSRSYAIIRSTLELAKSLGMSTVAEGVEDAHTATLLAGLGCSYAQGFHFALELFVGRPQLLGGLLGFRLLEWLLLRRLGLFGLVRLLLELAQSEGVLLRAGLFDGIRLRRLWGRLGLGSRFRIRGWSLCLGLGLRHRRIRVWVVASRDGVERRHEIVGRRVSAFGG